MTVGLVINTSGLYHTDIADSLEIPRAKVAVMQTMQALFNAFALLISQKVFARVKIKRLITTGVLCVGGGLILSSTFNHIFQFYIVWSIVGFFMPFLFSLTVPTMLANWFEKNLATVTGIAVSLTGIGGAVANYAVGRAIVSIGWRNTYICVGAVVLVTLLPFALFVFKMRPEGDERPYGHVEKSDESFTPDSLPGYTMAEAKKMPIFYLFTASMVFLALASGFMQQISPHIQSLGFDKAQGSSVMSAVMVGIASGKIIMGILLDKFKASRVIVLFSLIGFTGWFGLTRTGILPILLVFGVCVGLAHSLSQVVVPVTVRRNFGLKQYSAIYARITLFSSLTSAFMPAFGSMIYDMTGSYVTPIVIAAGAFFAAMPCLVIAAKGAGAPKERTVEE